MPLTHFVQKFVSRNFVVVQFLVEKVIVQGHRVTQVGVDMCHCVSAEDTFFLVEFWNGVALPSEFPGFEVAQVHVT